ncbi:hypothetical protein [uncultured Megasphaera sp.]|uniref:hypothetical protein n=1 Tax=uncultured Megasphaera sp. TaxID=165188 RepID=UPI00265CE0A1|nr:hypothetical protein [uncultured Megasphaera sp.]
MLRVRQAARQNRWRSDAACSACQPLRIRLRRHGASVTGEETVVLAASFMSV